MSDPLSYAAVCNCAQQQTPNIVKIRATSTVTAKHI